MGKWQKFLCLVALLCTLKAIAAYIEQQQQAVPKPPPGTRSRADYEALARVYLEVADGIKAGIYNDAQQPMSVTRYRNRQLLQGKLQDWSGWASEVELKLRRIKAEGKLDTPADVEREWRVIAQELQRDGAAIQLHVGATGPAGTGGSAQ